MFYELENRDLNLRFGDVIEGFQILRPIHNTFDSNKFNFHIDIENVKYFVVTTPCCSIEKSILSIAPLKKVRPAFFQNEYFAEDLTRINRLIAPEKTLPKFAWENLSDEEKQNRIGRGYTYGFIDLFIYEKCEYLHEYELNTKNGKISTGYYLLDFKEIFKIESNLIGRGKTVPKILQLSVRTRNYLRDKLAYYFNRKPDEDEE